MVARTGIEPVFIFELDTDFATTCVLEKFGIPGMLIRQAEERLEPIVLVSERLLPFAVREPFERHLLATAT